MYELNNNNNIALYFENDTRSVADTEGGGQGAWPSLEAHVPTLPLQKSVEFKAGKTQF